MPAISPASFVVEESDAEGSAEPNRTLWISEAGGLSQFGAFAVGHYLHNRSASPTRCLVVGARAQVDTITYPDHDRVCLRDRALPDDIWTNTAGQPADSPYR